MRFTRDSINARYMPRSYRPGELRINETTYRSPVVVSALALHDGPAIGTVNELTTAHAQSLLEQTPEVVLLGTGAEHAFAPPAFSASFLERGIGFESMSTAAACRTFSVLVAEQRQVVALLIP